MGSGFTHESPVNKTIEWYTPPFILEWLGLEFDLDPCHPIDPIPWVPARRTLNIHDDGLAADWHGSVWLNPPYGKHTPDWLAKLAAHGNGVALVFARTDVGWFHDLALTADAILFLRGRVQFVDASGQPPRNAKGQKSGPGCGSMLCAWGAASAAPLARLEREGKGSLWARSALQILRGD